jgi:hypothetical protein
VVEDLPDNARKFSDEIEAKYGITIHYSEDKKLATLVLTRYLVGKMDFNSLLVEIENHIPEAQTSLGEYLVRTKMDVRVAINRRADGPSRVDVWSPLLRGTELENDPEASS